MPVFGCILLLVFNIVLTVVIFKQRSAVNNLVVAMRLKTISIPNYWLFPVKQHLKTKDTF